MNARGVKRGLSTEDAEPQRRMGWVYQGHAGDFVTCMAPGSPCMYRGTAGWGV